MKRADVIQVLKRARRLISSQLRWVQHEYAIDKYWYPVDADSKNAVGWSASAAVARFTPSGVWSEEYLYCMLPLLELLTERGYGPLPLHDFNNDPTRTHGEILGLFDEAIAVEESK